MKKSLMVSCVLISMFAVGAPQPPESFCGFTFGEVYTNSYRVALVKPFRYCTQAHILTTQDEHRIFRITIDGRVDDISEDDMQIEFARMRGMIEKRFGILLKKNKWGGNWYEYNDGIFGISATYYPNGRSVTFSVNATRMDILDAWTKSKKHGAPPLPVNDGIENL